MNFASGNLPPVMIRSFRIKDQLQPYCLLVGKGTVWMWKKEERLEERKERVAVMFVWILQETSRSMEVIKERKVQKDRCESNTERECM